MPFDAQTAGSFLRHARDAQARLLEASETIEDDYLRALLGEALSTLERVAAAAPQGRVDRPAPLRPARVSSTEPAAAGQALARCADAFRRLRNAGAPLAAELGGERGKDLQRLVSDLERARGLLVHLADPERLARLVTAPEASPAAPADPRGVPGPADQLS